MSILNHLRSRLGSLSKAETRLAEAILAAPETVVTMATAELARKANVSDPSVSRFCKSLGCSSFPNFKVQLAQSLIQKASFISEAVSPGDTAASYIDKRINANQAALEHLRDLLSPTLIEQAVTLLSSARQIIIFGMGGSAAIAKDAQHKLFRLGIPTIAYEDELMQRMAAANAQQGDCFLLISFTGRTISMVDIAKLIRASPATLLVITSPESPLAQLADLTIPSGSELEDTTIYLPMTTRIVILTIVDILTTGLALAKGPDAESRLKNIKHSLDATKLPPN